MVKAPTVVTDEGIVLMESSLILAYAHSLVPAARHLQPQEPALLARCLRLTGLALAACEKAVQIVYEHNLRPTEKQHAPWIERVTGQMHAAFGALEAEVAPGAQWIAGDRLLDADITAAVAWRFTRFVLPDAVLPRDFPRLAALSERAEALPVFRATPID